MATIPFEERCGNCRECTPHEVGIELREEGRGQKNREHSREPYRVSVCQRCGGRSEQRMNAV